MATEMRVLAGDGQDNYTILAFFPIATPAQVGGVNVVPTPSSGLTGLAATVAGLSPDQRPGLDAGTHLYEQFAFHADPALDVPALIARLQEIYTAKATHWAAWYANAYKWVGATVDAPA